MDVLKHFCGGTGIDKNRRVRHNGGNVIIPVVLISSTTPSRHVSTSGLTLKKVAITVDTSFCVSIDRTSMSKRLSSISTRKTVSAPAPYAIPYTTRLAKARRALRVLGSAFLKALLNTASAM